MYMCHIQSIFVINNSDFAGYMFKYFGIVALYIVFMSAKIQLFPMHHVGLVRIPVKIVEFIH